jgi:hypothetical protein
MLTTKMSGAIIKGRSAQVLSNNQQGANTMAQEKKIRLTQNVFIEGKPKTKGTVISINADDADYLVASNKAEFVSDKDAAKEK